MGFEIFNNNIMIFEITWLDVFISLRIKNLEVWGKYKQLSYVTEGFWILVTAGRSPKHTGFVNFQH